MNILRSDLEKICNYVESDKPSLPKQIVHYIDYITPQDEWYINQLKRINRQNVINEVLDEEDDSDESDFLPFSGGNDDIGVVTPSIMTLPVTGNKFIDYKELYKDILVYIDNLTNSPMKTWTKSSLDLQIQNNTNISNHENILSISRRLLTKITFCGNLIAMTGRMGPANTIIVGLDVLDYLLALPGLIRDANENTTINGMKLVISEKIKSNKCIVLRSSNQLGPGLCVSKHDDGSYFMKETPNYEKTIAWFELI